MGIIHFTDIIIFFCSGMGIAIVGIIAACIGAVVVHIKSKRGAKWKEDDEIEQTIHYVAGMNTKPWKPKETEPDAPEGSQGRDGVWAKLGKAYEHAPGRTNVRRIIYDEEKRAKERIEDLKKRDSEEN